MEKNEIIKRYNDGEVLTFREAALVENEIQDEAITNALSKPVSLDLTGGIMQVGTTWKLLKGEEDLGRALMDSVVVSAIQQGLPIPWAIDQFSSIMTNHRDDVKDALSNGCRLVKGDPTLILEWLSQIGDVECIPADDRVLN